MQWSFLEIASFLTEWTLWWQEGGIRFSRSWTHNADIVYTIKGCGGKNLHGLGNKDRHKDGRDLHRKPNNEPARKWLNRDKAGETSNLETDYDRCMFDFTETYFV